MIMRYRAEMTEYLADKEDSFLLPVHLIHQATDEEELYDSKSSNINFCHFLLPIANLLTGMLRSHLSSPVEVRKMSKIILVLSQKFFDKNYIVKVSWKLLLI